MVVRRAPDAVAARDLEAVVGESSAMVQASLAADAYAFDARFLAA